MKVKAFEHVIQTDDRWGKLADIEDQINTWLQANPAVKIVEIKLSTCAATNNERAAPANLAALCLVFYEGGG